MWSVSQVVGRVKDVLEESFADVWVVGEISNFRPASSGHVYFNLKDKTALLHVVLWRGDALRLRFEPRDGLEVIVHGRVTVYPPRGDFQLTIASMIRKGEGEQEAALRRLQEKLQKFGYFARERKRPLCRFPKRLALVTSPTGAALRDMLEILGRRWPSAEVIVCPVRVQGVGAAADMVRALKQLNRLEGIDTIILGRGGGSSEDLAAFNEEVLAQAIFASRIPVVSAVGHEIDVTIADLVADVRALTPSEAAELATPDRLALLGELGERGARLQQLMQGVWQLGRQRLHNLASRRVLRQPLERIRDLERKTDDLRDRLDRAMRKRREKWQGDLASAASRLESLSPLNVLARGYSLTRTEQHRLLWSVQQVQAGQRVETILTDGRFWSRIDPEPAAQARGQAENGSAADE